MPNCRVQLASLDIFQYTNAYCPRLRLHVSSLTSLLGEHRALVTCRHFPYWASVSGRWWAVYEPSWTKSWQLSCLWRVRPCLPRWRFSCGSVGAAPRSGVSMKAISTAPCALRKPGRRLRRELLRSGFRQCLGDQYLGLARNVGGLHPGDCNSQPPGRLPRQTTRSLVLARCCELPQWPAHTARHKAPNARRNPVSRWQQCSQ